MKLRNISEDRGLENSHLVTLPRAEAEVLDTASNITSLEPAQILNNCLARVLQPSATDQLRAEINRCKLYFK